MTPLELVLAYLLTGFVLHFIAASIGWTVDIAWRAMLRLVLGWPATLVFVAIIYLQERRRP
jgi:VIT1/CCC1 family predicted Fe2+/Mn2+ transporter